MRKLSFSGFRRSVWYIPIVIFIFFWSFYSLTARGVISEADGIVNFMTTRSIVEDGTFSIPCGDYPNFLIAQGVEGKCYGKYGIGLPVLSLPMYLGGRLVAGPAPQDPNALSFSRFLVSLLNQFVTAGTCSALCIIGLRMTNDRKRAIELTFVFGLLTIAWPYASTFFSQPITGFLLLVPVVLVGGSNHSLFRYLFAGLAMGLVFLVRVDSLPLILLVSIWIMYKLRIEVKGFNKDFISFITIFLLPLIVSFVIFAITQISHYGAIFQSGYEGEGWTTPFFVGFFGQTLSFGKGIVFYSPLILLALTGLVILYRQGIKDLPVLAVLLFITQLLIYSSWWSWMGGWSWGPRFLIPSLPLIMLGLLPWLNTQKCFVKTSLAFLIPVSFIVQVIGVTTDPLQYHFTHEIIEKQFLYNPATSPICIQFQYMMLREVSLLVLSNAHDILTPVQTIMWVVVSLLLMILSGRELMMVLKGHDTPAPP